MRNEEYYVEIWKITGFIMPLHSWAILFAAAAAQQYTGQAAGHAAGPPTARYKSCCWATLQVSMH
jgi:hypothetical protein